MAPVFRLWRPFEKEASTLAPKFFSDRFCESVVGWSANRFLDG